jgi:hypothetical protein
MKLLTNSELIQIEQRLTVLFNNATELEISNGKNWYNDAQQFSKELSEKYGIELTKVANVVSALSPNSKWLQNKIGAEKMINNFVLGNSVESFKVQTFNTNKYKAWNVLTNGILIDSKSKKTFAFASNILGQDDNVTIDLWHLRACFGCTIEGLSEKNYILIQDVTVKLARQFGLKGYEFQAILWLTVQRLFKY